MRVGIIGAGAAGLAAAYELGKHGHKVTVYEQAPFIGGQASTFDVGGTRLERGYHHLFTGDVDMINQVDAKGLKLIDRAEGVHVNSTPSGLYGGICCLKNTAPGENDDFVRGMQLIQDREKIVRSFLKGHALVRSRAQPSV